MNSGELMVVLIVAIVMTASILKTLFRGPHHHHEGSIADPGMASETRHLRSEVQELKERIKVLERITVEKENSLAKEIESLRDR